MGCQKYALPRSAIVTLTYDLSPKSIFQMHLNDSDQMQRGYIMLQNSMTSSPCRALLPIPASAILDEPPSRPSRRRNESPTSTHRVIIAFPHKTYVSIHVKYLTGYPNFTINNTQRLEGRRLLQAHRRCLIINSAASYIPLPC